MSDCPREGRVVPHSLGYLLLCVCVCVCGGGSGDHHVWETVSIWALQG